MGWKAGLEQKEGGKMTTYSTREMIVMARAWLPNQTALTPRDLLGQLRDMCVALLLPENPPQSIPAVGIVDFTTRQVIDMAMAWVAGQEHLTPEQFLTQLRDGCDMVIRMLPVPVPVPTGDDFRAVLWGDAHNGAEQFGCLNLAIRHGMSGEPQAFLRDCKGIRARGGNCYLYVADSVMVSHPELFMFITNAKSPVDGHRMNDSENCVVIARNLGVTKWVVSIFNDDATSVPPNGHEAWIKKLCGWYDWAGVKDVVLIICLEADERFSVADTVQRAKWCKQYAPALRVVVGSAQPDYLKQVAVAAKTANVAVELAPETSWNPTSYGSINWPEYKATITDLQKTGCPIWWGEALEPNMTIAAELTAWAKSAGMAGHLFGKW